VDSSVNVQSYFIVGGQILDHKPAVYMVYPQGNYISTSADTTYLQIGESKYGKPILDRILTPEVSLETAAMCALVSMDSTLRSNLTVGPPIELSIYPKDSLKPGKYYRFEDDSEYLRQLKKSWDQLLKDAFMPNLVQTLELLRPLMLHGLQPRYLSSLDFLINQQVVQIIPRYSTYLYQNLPQRYTLILYPQSSAQLLITAVSKFNCQISQRRPI